LVADIERLREQLGIDKWLIFGGSWGSTLALAYAITHPKRCTEMVLRGIFLLNNSDIHWFYQHGCHLFFPEAWEKYRDFIPPEERDDFVLAYHKRLHSQDIELRTAAGIQWCAWESSALKLIPPTLQADTFRASQPVDAFARIENNYMINKGFFPHDNYLLENVSHIQHIPCTIIHGRYDMICPVSNAWELFKAWGKNATLHIIPDAGHSAGETGITEALLNATDQYALV
jgi:proline iminopeptidase